MRSLVETERVLSSEQRIKIALNPETLMYFEEQTNGQVYAVYSQETLDEGYNSIGPKLNLSYSDAVREFNKFKSRQYWTDIGLRFVAVFAAVVAALITSRALG